LHLQKAFAGLGYRANDFPVSESCANRIFSVPMHPYLDEETITSIADALR
jgi:dTDP-4-amino-4,6-dideoxygalactose transaminase